VPANLGEECCVAKLELEQASQIQKVSAQLELQKPRREW